MPDLRQPPAEEAVFFPASFAQQSLWFIDQLTPGKATYNIPGGLRIRGKLDVQVLKRTLEEIARRHETLRTRFVAVSGEPQQVIEDQVSIELVVRDLTFVSGEQEREAEAMRLAREEAQTPFNLKLAPLFRGKLLRLGGLDHVLLFTTHHIISDAWSTGVLVEEVSVLYEAFSAGRPSPLPELPIQYADYSVWQRECLDGGLLEPQLAYWKQQLAGSSMLLLPSDRPRPPAQSQSGATCDFVVDANVTHRVKKLAEEQGATLFMVLLAAFQTLLYRYSGQHDVAVGTPIAGRNSSDTERLIGFFINTLVLRTDLSGAPPFIELLRRTKAVTLEAYGHQDVPFEKLVEVVAPERNLSGTPLFQVMIVLQNAPQSDLRLGTALLQPFSAVDNGTAKFDLLLQLGEDGSGKLIGSLQYSTDLFDAASADRIIGHYRVLLSGIAANPAQSIDLLPLLTTHERKRLVQDWNNTSQKFPREKCLPDLIEEQAARTPEAIAVEHQAGKLTYRELNERANRLGHYLQVLGVGPEVRVGICLDRGLEVIIGLLGILKAGGAYVPLDPSYPAERLRYMLVDSQATVLITQQFLLPRLPSFAGTLVRLDDQWPEISGAVSHNPVRAIIPENLAYVIYTSGSTGLPKGVAICHSNAVAFQHWSRTVFSAEEFAGVLASTSICFDLSVFEIFVPLACGGRIILVKNALDLVGISNDLGVKLVNTVPSAMRELVRLNAVPESVQTINLAGEALSGLLVHDIYELKSIDRLFNLYGPSEDTTYSTYALMLRDKDATVTIGKPLANTQTYILDTKLQPVPIGIVGELHIGGSGLARGYLNRPDLTADRFRPNPFGFARGERLYRTGDLARYREDGNLEFLGRMDQQVKLRGYRIELGEIEAVLEAEESVHQAVVIVQEEEAGDKKLVAYLVAEPVGKENDPANRVGLRMSELREHLQAKLPEYMVPASYVQLDELPLTSNGKIDRRALSEVSTQERRDEEGYVAPRTPIEKLLARIWADMLRVDLVGIHDNFFKLGGHSLMAIQVIARIRESLSMELPVKAIFEQPTIAGVAKKLEGESEANAAMAPPPIARCSREGRLPLSFAQQRLWFLDQLEPGNRVHHIPTLLRLKGALDIEVLSSALDEIVCRHEILRTSFPAADAHPYQKISPPAPISIEKTDLQDVPRELREEKLRTLADLHIRMPFDLAQGPLFRVALYRMEEQENVLCLTVHHIICDALSVPILIRELNILYQTFLNGTESPLPALPLQYADVAAWEREWLRDEVLERHIHYWRQALEGAPQILDLPTDFPRPAVRSFDAGRRTFCLSPQLSSELKKLSQHQGATEFMTLLALMNVWLFRYSGQSDILVGTPVSSRTQVETEALIGIFLNTLVLRTKLDAQARFTELVDQVRLNAVGAYAHQALPFEKLVEELHVVRDPSRNPVFQVMFNMLAEVTDKLEFAGLIDNEAIETDAGQARFDIHLNALPTPGGLELAITYNCGLFQQSTITSMLETFAELARVVVEDPEIAISELVEKAVRFEQESALARKRGHSQEQGHQLRTVRRRAAVNESR